MKAHTLKVLLVLFCFGFISCDSEPEDPCLGVQCISLKDNRCQDGICTCETNSWSYVTWTLECINCGSNISTLFVDLEIGGVKVTSVELQEIWDHTRTLQSFKLIDLDGTQSYRILSGPTILEEGNINLQTCQLISTSSQFSI